MWIIISGILGIAGFIVSLINVFYFFVTKIRKLKICFKKYKVKNFMYNQYVSVFYQFENLSQLNISITNVKLVVQNETYDYYTDKFEVSSFVKEKNGTTVYGEYTFNDTLPINLLPLFSKSGYLTFELPKGTIQENCKELTFQICTNRGNVIQSTFVLDDFQIFR